MLHKKRQVGMILVRDPAKTSLRFGTLNALAIARRAVRVCRLSGSNPPSKKKGQHPGERDQSWLPFGQYPLGLIEHEVV